MTRLFCMAACAVFLAFLLAVALFAVTAAAALLTILPPSWLPPLTASAVLFGALAALTFLSKRGAR